MVAERGWRQPDLGRNRRQSINQLLQSYGSGSGTANAYKGPLSTMEMARQVLKSRGTDMTPSEIGAAIEKKWGVAPSKSLGQMLYKRARARSSFVKHGNKYGLLQLDRKKH